MGSVCNTCNDPCQPGGHNDVGMPRIEVQKQGVFQGVPDKLQKIEKTYPALGITMRRDHNSLDKCWPKIEEDGIKFLEIKRWHTDAHGNLV